MKKQPNHTITVKNLGPLVGVQNFEVKNFNLLIGKSAAGKSVLARVVFLFNYIFGSRTGVAIPVLSPKRGEAYVGGLFGEFFPEYQSYKIRYEYAEGMHIAVKETAGEVRVEFSAELKKRLEKYEREMKKFRGEMAIRELHELLAEDGEKAKEELQQKIANLNLGDGTEIVRKNSLAIKNTLKEDLGVCRAIFIPDIRNFPGGFDGGGVGAPYKPGGRLSFGGGSEAMSEMDIAVRLFSDDYRPVKRFFRSLPKEYEEIAKGKVQKQGEQIFLTTPDGGQTLPVDQLSSGQKGVIPILIFLQHIAERNLRTLLIIEEPEAHLFPADQAALLEKIAEVANATRSKVFITTHSPILLMKANNLIEAAKKKYERLDGRFLPHGGMQACKIEGGKCEPAMDVKSRLIDGGYIEDETEKVMDEFDEIVESKL